MIRTLFLLPIFSLTIALSPAAPEQEFEYGSEYAIWVHDEPAKLKVQKEAELITDLFKAPDTTVKVKMEASAKGPKPDLPGSPPSKVAVEFEGYASLEAGDIRLRVPPTKPKDKSLSKIHRCRLRQIVIGGKNLDYVKGTILLETGHGVTLEATVEGGRFRTPLSNPHGALLHCILKLKSRT